MPVPKKTREFSWTEAREKAAALVAQDELTNAAISEEIGISVSTLANWKNTPEFIDRVDEHLTAFRAAVRRRGIAVLERRVDALNDRWLRLRSVLDERAAANEATGVPGGRSGLVIKQTKAAGSGGNFQLIDEYVVDIALLKELREHEKQAAQELGQWIEGYGNDLPTKAYITLGPEDLWPSDPSNEPTSPSA